MLWRKGTKAVTWEDEAARLWNAIRTLQAHMDELQESTTMARLKYLEGVDKVLGKFAGRMAKRLQAEEEEQQQPEQGGVPRNYRGNLRGW